MKAKTAIIAALAVLSGIGPAHAQQLAPLPEGVPAEANYTSYGTPVTLAQAQTALDAALAEAAARGWPVAIAVVTPSGDLIAFAMMDDTQLIAPDIAINKARTAAMFRRPTSAFAQAMQANAVAATLHPVLVASPGGVPIVVGGRIIGALGCSGVAGPQDEVVCAAGARALAQ